MNKIELRKTLLNYEIDPLANEIICGRQQATCQIIDHDHGF